MNAVKFLFAAYVATWVIHVFYIGTLVADSAGCASSFVNWAKGSSDPGRV